MRGHGIGEEPAGPVGANRRGQAVARIGEGLLAGALLGAFDWVATGIARTPTSLVVMILVWGLACGLLAGLVGALARRRGVALGLLVAGGLFLHAGSTYTKFLGGPSGGLAAGAWIGAMLALAVVTGVLAARRAARVPGWTWPAVVVAAIPGASLLWTAVPPTPLALLCTCALPLLVVLVWTLPLPPLGGAVALPLTVVALSIPSSVAGEHTGPARAPDAAASSAAPDRPDIVLVIVDTLRADHAFPSDPGATPPTFGRLAREGVRFDQAVSSASWTLPSISSLFTSLPPSRHGAVERTRSLPEDVVTLAERLHAAGYETVAFTGGGYVGPAYGLAQGFEEFEPLAEYRLIEFRGHIPFVWRVLNNRWLPLHSLIESLSEFGAYGGLPRIREYVGDWLAHRDRSRPFFLLVHTYQVHDYFVYQPTADDAWLASRGGPPADVKWRPRVEPEELEVATQEQLDWYHEVYRHRVDYVAGELAPLLEEVERAAGPGGLIGCLTADHGEGFDAARHRVHHGGRLHDDVLRVPLVLWAPGRLDAGRAVAQQVRLLDVMPTLLELAGLPVPDGLAGRSLLPLLAGRDEDPRIDWSEDQIGVHQVALRAPPWKIVDSGNGAQVFRIDTDPLEDHPLDLELPEDLRKRWEARAEVLAPRAEAQATLDGATEEQLRRLGY